MKLRKYQSEAVEAIFEAWQNFKRVLVVLPTGCGKTVVFASVIKRLLSDPSCSRSATTERLTPRRTIVLAHREELITQAKEKIAAIVPEADVQIEMADFKVVDYFGKKADVVVSTVQTQCAPLRSSPQSPVPNPQSLNRRFSKFDPNDFAALVIDEAHHATAKSYREVVDYYTDNDNCRVLGVTATPDRADETALGNVFDTVAYTYSMNDAIDDGWLVPVRQKLVKVESLDFSRVSTSAGDLNTAELAEVMEDEKNLHGIVSPVLEICKGKKSVLFAASVKQAERLCEIINRYSQPQPANPQSPRPDSNPSVGCDTPRPDSNPSVGCQLRANWVCGATPKDERRRRIQAFKDGEIDILCNVGVLTEGFDDSETSVIVMARPTKSRALYAQMAGRATRPAAEIAAKLGEVEDAAIRRQMIADSSKPSCLIVDFVGNSGRHKLVTTLDILGGKEVDDEEIRTRARSLISEKSEQGDSLDTAEAIAEARKEVEARRAAEAKRREFVKASATYVQIDVDPFNVYDLPPVERTATDRMRHLSLKQENLLRTRLRVNPDDLGYARSTQLLKEFFRRVENGLASLPQVKLLKHFGIEVPVRRDEARRIIDRLIAANP